ncbi:MAG: iron-containing alcohol dehydrogenase family protein [Candidatus Wallbacteria bacterium]|nr:iron-containing alcohol dehydrogenase family protein [Candidatus Wallbacteria bacterium]
MLKTSRNVPDYLFGRGAITHLKDMLQHNPASGSGPVLFLADHFFRSKGLDSVLPVSGQDRLIFIDSTDEPTTSGINALRNSLESDGFAPAAVVGIGGGTTLDTAKALSNLLTNGGNAEDYQGWDLVKVKGVHKIGVPTLSGTGAESSRTCVMTNAASGLKLGMNSHFTVFDQLVLDPDLTATVPSEQYFYSGADTYIHCIESLHGRFRHPVGDAFSDQALRLSREVFQTGNMLSPENREKLMVASYLGGCAIANSFVGVVHPVSAGLSVVLHIHHCLGNCLALNALEEFYPAEVEEFRGMLKSHEITLPRGVCSGLDESGFEQLYNATVIHEKPLSNALGDSFKDMLTRKKLRSIFETI